ncbi:MAG: glycine--tRNA ligase [Candidatus Aenigmatarchaeota archaeon]
MSGEKKTTIAAEVEALAKRRGFFWPAAQLYNPVAGFWNYGPLGTAVKNNFVDMWRKWWVRDEGAYEIDTSDILPEIVWQASGHTEGFNDKQVMCKGKEKHRWRADILIEDTIKYEGRLEGKTTEELTDIIRKNKIKCPKCGAELGEVFVFNLMFNVNVGPTGETKCYLKPETTQSSVLDFPFIYRSQRAKLPLKIAQIGKSFRNEISPRQVFIRMREFWMAELQIFFNPANTEWPAYKSIKDFKVRILPANLRDTVEEPLDITVDSAIAEGYIPNKLIGYYLAKVQQFYEALGFDRKCLRFKELLPTERAHYSKVHWDFEIYTEDFGWVECVNNAWRSDYDLSRHAKFSKQSLSVFEDGMHILPNMYEPSFGIDRTIWMLMLHAYRNDGKRTWLALPPALAPYQVAIFPLVRREGMDEKAKKLCELLNKQLNIFYDEADSIGRRYARADEIGIPYCITVDGETLRSETVTLRDRDTTAQVRVAIDRLQEVIEKLFEKQLPFTKAGARIK